MQQAEVIREQTGYQVGHYCGEMGQDFWDARRWQREFESKQVLWTVKPEVALDLIKYWSNLRKTSSTQKIFETPKIFVWENISKQAFIMKVYHIVYLLKHNNAVLSFAIVLKVYT